MSATISTISSKYANIISANGDQMRPYQLTDGQKIADNRDILLPAPMGYGKTLITLTALVELLEANTVRRIVIFAPLRVCQLVWEKEAQDWPHTRNLLIANGFGGEKPLVKAVNSDADIVLINFENLSLFCELYGDRHNFDCVVYDELDKMKSPKSNRSKAIKRLHHTFKRHIGLTGTFITETPLDIFAQVSCLQLDIFGKSFYKWRDQYFYAVDRNQYYWVAKKGALDEIMAKIAHLVLHVDQVAYEKLLPALTNYDVLVHMPLQAQIMYKKFERDFVHQCKDKNHVVAVNKGVLSNKLQQYTQGFLYKKDNSVECVHKSKRRGLESVIDTYDEPILVAYKYKDELTYLQNEYDAAYIGGSNFKRNKEVIQEWDQGNIPLLAIHPQSAGHGLNLQRGGRILTWLGVPWSLSAYLQTTGRLRRPTQKHEVEANHIVIEGTIDERMAQGLENKEDLKSTVSDYLQRLAA